MAEDLRILVVKGADEIAANLFGAVIVDGKGTTRVGQTDLHSQEVAPAIAATAAVINDAAIELNGTDAEEFAKEVFTDPNYLQKRVELLEALVQANRMTDSASISQR